jgi:hypothetical protein
MMNRQILQEHDHQGYTAEHSAGESEVVPLGVRWSG